MRYAVTIFISSFFIFQIQPVIARFILPWYGGSAAVWTTCMLFFLTMLLAGYSYAYFLSRYLNTKKQAIVHICLIFISLLLLPFTPAESLKPIGTENPSVSLLVTLIYSIGIPYVLIAATNPLYQNWFNLIYPRVNPFRLYSLSNLGSLIGLLSYPFIIEHILELRTQTHLLSTLYVLYAIFSLYCAFPFLRSKSLSSNISPHPSISTQNVSWIDKLLWILLSVCGVILLLAVTNRITFDLPVVPFFWIIPLCLYLLSFIICFNKPSWYDRKLWALLFVFSLVFIVLFTYWPQFNENYIIRGIILSVVLFVSCMVVHGELYHLRPPPAKYLTQYYLFIALGGAIGGVFVAVVATNLFNDFWEFYIGLIAVFILLGIVILRSSNFSWTNNFLRSAVLIWSLFLALFIWQIYTQMSRGNANIIFKKRNFYGLLSVRQGIKSGHIYTFLNHGEIVHGGQFRDEDKRKIPTSYFTPESGVAFAIKNHPKRYFYDNLNGYENSDSLKIGVLGMGVATLSTYLDQNDEIIYYELDPDVVEIAKEYFYFLTDTKANYHVVVGDARSSLEREFKNGEAQNYDIMVMDAFIGDAPPLHLLTEEAFNLYWSHLKHDGILAVHISNLYIDFRPLILGWAKKYGKQFIEIYSEAGTEDWVSTSLWVLVTSNEKFLNDPKVKIKLRESTIGLSKDKLSPIILTDENSNLFTLIKLGYRLD